MTFLADDGHFLIKDNPSRFSSMFDWIVTEHKVLKYKDIPNSIFVKTDYLPRFVNQDFPQLKNPFVLITGSSDWCPSINFPVEYSFLLNSVFVKKWYMLNCLSEHPKVFSYPGGLCHNETSDNILRYIRAGVNKHESNKILCIWRDRNFNVCGDQFITRKTVEQFVKQRPDVFDWVDADMNTEDFYKLLSRYKFVLCPVGNGVDPCPKAFEAIIVKTVPIMIKTINTQIYEDFSVMLVDNFNTLVTMSNLGEIYEKLNTQLSDDSILHKLSCEYWYSNVMNED